jgi:hypothetical protein
MGKKYSIADEGEIHSRKPGDEDPDVEVEIEGDEPAPREEQSDEELFDDIVPARSKTPRDDEPEDEEEPDEDEESDDEEPSPRSKDTFEKRLARERRLLRETREENKEILKELRHFRDAVLKKGAEDEFNRVKAESDTKLAELKKDLAQAIEDGATDRQVEITDKISDLKADIRVKEAELKRAKEAEASAPETDRAQRAAQQWIRKHSRYHSDPVFRAAAIALDKKLLAEGSDNADSDHYKKIDRELARRFPEEYKTAPRRRKEPVVYDARSGGDEREDRKGGFIRRGKKVIISAKQAENMRRFGLDPESADDVKAYVRENS